MPRRLSQAASARHQRVRTAARRDGTYDALLEAQGGVCAICAALPHPDRQFDLDHDHKTGAIRGLLCRGCNMRLRKDHKPEWLEAAADYLRQPPGYLLTATTS